MTTGGCSLLTTSCSETTNKGRNVKMLASALLLGLVLTLVPLISWWLARQEHRTYSKSTRHRVSSLRQSSKHTERRSPPKLEVIEMGQGNQMKEWVAHVKLDGKIMEVTVWDTSRTM